MHVRARGQVIGSISGILTTFESLFTGRRPRELAGCRRLETLEPHLDKTGRPPSTQQPPTLALALYDLGINVGGSIVAKRMAGIGAILPLETVSAKDWTPPI